MKYIISLCMLMVLLSCCHATEKDQIIAGTNVAMNISEIFKWDRFSNLYHTGDGSCTMRVAYLKSDLNSSIQRFRKKLLQNKHLLIDQESQYSNEKYLLLYHSDLLENIKYYLLFVGNDIGTSIFSSEILISLFPNIPEKILDIYKACRITEKTIDAKEVVFFSPDLPEEYIFMEFDGNHFNYGLSFSSEASVSFRGSLVRIAIDPKKILRVEVARGDIVVSEDAIRSNIVNYSIWRTISQDTITNAFRCQFAVQNNDHMLIIDATFGDEIAKNEIEVLSRFVSDIRFITDAIP